MIVLVVPKSPEYFGATVVVANDFPCYLKAFEVVSLLRTKSWPFIETESDEVLAIYLMGLLFYICSLTFTVSRGMVQVSAIQAARAAVNDYLTKYFSADSGLCWAFCIKCTT